MASVGPAAGPGVLTASAPEHSVGADGSLAALGMELKCLGLEAEVKMTRTTTLRSRLRDDSPVVGPTPGSFDVGTVGDGIKGRSRHIPKYTNRCIEKTGNPPQVAFQSPSRQPSNRNTRLCRHKPGDPIKRCLQRPQVSAAEDYPRAPNFNESKSYRLPEAFALTGFLFDRRQSQA